MNNSKRQFPISREASTGTVPVLDAGSGNFYGAWMLDVGAFLACASCGSANGDMASSPLTDGMNLGILTLFVVIATMLGLIAAFFVYLIRREAALAAKTTPHNLSEAKA